MPQQLGSLLRFAAVATLAVKVPQQFQSSQVRGLLVENFLQALNQERGRSQLNQPSRRTLVDGKGFVANSLRKQVFGNLGQPGKVLVPIKQQRGHFASLFLVSLPNVGMKERVQRSLAIFQRGDTLQRL